MSLSQEDEFIFGRKEVITSTSDESLTTTDITANNVTSSKHGFAPKTEADATKFLNSAATGAWALVKDSDLSTSDITTNDASITKHGFLKKLDNTATNFLDGTGSFDTVKDSDLSTSDITTNNASTTKHGFLKKLDNTATNFMDGTGNWSAPAGGGGALTFMYKNRGTMTATSETELDTKTWTANDFAVNDLILIFLMWRGTGAVALNQKLRVADGTNTFTSGTFSQGTGSTYNWAMALFGQGNSATTDLGNTVWYDGSSGTVVDILQEATMISNWLSSAFTISLRGWLNSATTGYWSWWIYKVKSS